MNLLGSGPTSADALDESEQAPAVAGSIWKIAERNALQTQRVIQFCRKFANGWLAHADPRSGLIPRNLNTDFYWNARDAAADNYPFIVLTAHVTDDFYLKLASLHILTQEQNLANRLDSLPDDFLFASQTFKTEAPVLDDVTFGAAEYAKDGLMPVLEWLGPSPWLDRMQHLVRDVFKHAAYDTPAGKIPSLDVEVNGDLLQVVSRLYWQTGDEDYKTWAFCIADYYLLHKNLLEMESIRLRDHGSEIIGGLSEACVIAFKEDKRRWTSYQPKIRAVLDRILEIGTNPDGLMFNSVNPKTGEVVNKGLADTWGYVYNAYLTISLLDTDKHYRDAVVRTLSNIHKYKDYDWEAGSADGYADSIESALNLLNRIPIGSAFNWVEQSMDYIFSKQRDDGIIEGWHGDGNSARTALMYALWKTQGITASPWRGDLRLGAERSDDGHLYVYLAGERPWSGRLRFDRPRHRDQMHLPFDYPRINQFPEWFTVDANKNYEVKIGEGTALSVDGYGLYDYPLTIKPDDPLRLTICVHEDPAAPKQRSMKYTGRSSDQAVAWQRELREKLFRLMKIEDLVEIMGKISRKLPGETETNNSISSVREDKKASTSSPYANGIRRNAEPDKVLKPIPMNPIIRAEEERKGHLFQEVEFQSTPGRRIKAIVTIPRTGTAPFPAVVCIHGHGGDRRVVYDRTNIYKGFADVLAESGYVTIAVDVGQHEVYEPGRTLMGERLWDLMRSVDYLQSLKEVDAARIGCAGLSLGGEMAMWLAAMDERIAACVSSGFLTIMDQMEHNHCMCWKFDGLRELVDFADIYSLIAPRPLQCQNGLAEPPTQFIVPLAKQAMKEVRTIYRDFGKPENVALAVHRGGHEIDLPSLATFFRHHLNKSN